MVAMRFLVKRSKARALEEQNLQSPSKIKVTIGSTSHSERYFQKPK
jgi:hypothetical protein